MIANALNYSIDNIWLRGNKSDLLTIEEAEFSLEMRWRPDWTILKKYLLLFAANSKFEHNSWLCSHLNKDETIYLRKNGLLFDGKDAILEVMQSGECHKNCERLAKEKNYLWFYGLALGQNNVWCIHSFCLNKEFQVIETTPIPRKLYFGLKVSDEILARK